LIGLDVKATPDVQQSQVDAFPTPHTRFNARLSPGVEVHANMLQNLIHGSWITNPSSPQKILFLSFMAIIGFLATQTFNPYYSFGALLVASISAFGASAFSWQQGYFLTAFAAFPSYIISFVASGAHAYLTEGKQKRQIKGAFAQYLAPDMVDALIADPDKLTLGGEKKKMTIMFCDVRGFTAISEALKEQPEVLAEVINTLLTELTNDILECGGTIDKYMGDCIMAFWNAPVENPKHAELAVEAAQKMMKTIYKVNDKIGSQGGVSFDLRIGIGIATGECVVGNMGSKQRFDYTVLGDVVNLASRLEGQTKGYGVTTVLCKNTAAAISDKSDLILEIDKIRVKGKTDPEIIFGLLERAASEEDLNDVSEYLKDFRAGHFDKSRKALDNLLKREDSSVFAYATLMKNRIKELSKLPLSDDWDGVYTAETK
jgi:adenylate cyclase